ncbi:MAG: ACP S-malonyltransferase [Chloroflexota bacterium]|nr:ACP S-malonyltransferase [Chloroflexota bacterium]
MGRSALLFPGQGSQYVGMARDIYDALPDARATIDRADQLLGFPLSRLMFEGPGDLLTRTDNAQPAIFVASIALLRSADLPLADVSCVAGHSVGEYSAVVAAGAMDFDEALRLVRRRGELMHQSGTETPGGMLAVLGLEDDAVEEACADVRPLVVCTANYNAPGQTIVSGELAGLEAVTHALKARGARRVLPLNVSAAFHSPVMAHAAKLLAEDIRGAAIRDPRWPVVGNASAAPLRTAGDLQEELAEQIASPVRWHSTIRYMLDAGVTTFIEVGPGKVLTGLMKRMGATSEARNVSDLASLRSLANAVAG